MKHNLILLLTNKEEPNKILLLEDIIADLASLVAWSYNLMIVVCYRH